MPFKPKWIKKSAVLVRINRILQKKMRERLGTSGLLIADHKNTFMENNMQCGEILMVGEKMKEVLPQACAGDTLIFSHFIEGSVQSFDNKGQDNMNDEYLLEQDAIYNYYIVPQSEIFGVAKDGTIFPVEKKMFALPHRDEENIRSIIQKGKLFVFAHYRESVDDVQQKIDELKETMQQTTKNEVQIKYMKEMEVLTNKLNSYRFAKFHPQYVHENFHRDCGRTITKYDVAYCKAGVSKDITYRPYELRFNGVTYAIINVDNIAFVSRDVPLKITDFN